MRTVNRWGGISNHLSMAYYWNRTTIVEIIIGGSVVSFFWHSVVRLSFSTWQLEPLNREAPCVKLSDEDFSCYSNKIESVGLRKCTRIITILLRKWCRNNKHLSELAPIHGGKPAGIDMVWRNLTSLSPCVSPEYYWVLEVHQVGLGAEVWEDIRNNAFVLTSYAV